MKTVVKIIEAGFNQKEFDQVAPHPLQSWAWGEARQKMGIDILRLGEFQDDKLKNVFTITFHQIPHTPFTIGYLPRSVIPAEETIQTISEESKKRHAIFIKLEPYEKVGQSIAVLSSLTKSSHPLFPQWTQMLDLTPTEDKLLEKMKPKTRYDIKIAQKHGVVIKEMTTDEGFEIFAKLYFQTTKRQRYHGHNENYHKIIFDTLKKNISHIFIAFYKDIPLSAYHLFLFNDILYYPYGGSSEENKEVMASNLLMWETIRFGKQQGAKNFDLWGSLPSDYDRSASWSGFTRFKEGYGTEFVEFIGSYDLVINPVLYPLYNLTHRIRSRLL